MSIKRISEIDTASFVKQLEQRCATLDYQAEKINNRGEDSIRSSYWKEVDDKNGAETTDADLIYCIQRQLVYNIDALNGIIRDTTPSGHRREVFTNDTEIFFWGDIVEYTSDESKTKEKVKLTSYTNTETGRTEISGDGVFIGDSYKESTYKETSDSLSKIPKTHAERSYIEVSEYVSDETDTEKNSNYVSRKVTLLWLFNVIKAICDLKMVFRKIIVGLNPKKKYCDCTAAENDPDGSNENRGEHTFYRCKNPDKQGRLTVYGNAELNGNYTTFHSETRFHDLMSVWGTMNVYGQSNFSKDINGTALHVRWGDLAENYESDAEYAPGTLVKFGGEKEITVADSVANAVVSTKPGLVLDSTSGLSIALCGKVPVKVSESVRKFDLLVPDPHNRGFACKKRFPEEKSIGRALEDSHDGVVLSVTQFSID